MYGTMLRQLTVKRIIHYAYMLMGLWQQMPQFLLHTLLKQLEVKIIFVEVKMVTILMELSITLQYGKELFQMTKLGIFMKDR